MEVCEGDSKQENADAVSQGSNQNNRKQSENDDPPLKIGEHYLVRRSDDTWREYHILCLLPILSLK